MTALTNRLRTDDDRDAVERLKAATEKGTASRAILRAVREWPDLVDELAEERRRVRRPRSVAPLEVDDALRGAKPSCADPRHALPGMSALAL